MHDEELIKIGSLWQQEIWTYRVITEEIENELRETEIQTYNFKVKVTDVIAKSIIFIIGFVCIISVLC